MAFPQDPLPIRAEMQISSTWTDVTTRVRSENDIVIRGGYAPEQTSIQPGSLAFTLNNRDGRFTDDNPNSPYYRALPTNTPFRTSVVESTPFLRQPNGIAANPLTATAAEWEGSFAWTADKASLDVTGDLDLRIEVEPDTWSLGGVGHALAGKYTTSGAQRSWAWVVQPSGQMRLYWSADGNSPLTPGTYATSDAVIPTTSRIALRVTIDVNNGAAGRTVVFYTSDSITGTWTQLGSTIVQSGTTSIFSSSAALTVGAVVETGLTVYPFVNNPDNGPILPMVGRVHRFQMRSGIGGTLVADMNAGAQSEGATSWSDGLTSPNTWTLANDAEITLADIRGIGEIAELPQDWDITGTDVFVPTTANGIMRRITQGAKALQSPIYRNLRKYVGAGALGYWPLEGGSQTTAAGNSVPGQPSAIVKNVLFAGDTTFPASAGAMTITDSSGYIVASVKGAPSANQAFCIFYYKLPSTPGSDMNIFNWFLSGTGRRVQFTVASGSYKLDVFDASGTNIGSSNTGFGTFGAPGQWLALQMKATKNGSGVDYDLGWYALGSTSFYGAGAVNVASATVGAPTGFSTGGGAGTMQAQFAHIMIGNLSGWEFVNAAFSLSSIAYVGETAADRWLRVLSEEGVEGRLIGWPADTDPMGPQPIDTLSAICDECAITSGSLQYEARDQLVLTFRTQRSLVLQNAAPLDYAAFHLSGSYRPTQDDQGLKNRVTANNRTGSFAISSKDTGVKSTSSPPNGVGLYDSSLPVNAASDDQLPTLAGWAVFVGTWPARRVPNIEVWLERSPFTSSATLTRTMRSVNPGDRLTVANNPAWVGSGTTDNLVRGYTETLKNRGHQLAFSSVPYGPYGAVSDLSGRPSVRRASTAYGNSRVAANTGSAATTIPVVTRDGAVWGTTASKPGNFPLDAIVGGEQVTVSGIAAYCSDTFTRSVSSDWGSTSTGGFAWLSSGGSGSDYNVLATFARMNLSTTAVARQESLDFTTRVRELVFDRVQMTAALTGVGATCNISIRIGTSTSYASLNIQMNTAGSATHWMSQVVSGSTVVSDTAFPATGLSTTAAMSCRIRVTNDQALARIWAPTVPEPNDWTTVIDLAQQVGAGTVTVTGIRSAASTNAAPFNIEFDGLTLPRNQLFTVSARSVNGIVKAPNTDQIVTLVDEFYAGRGVG